MKKLNKKQLRQLIKEVIQERWSDILTKSIIPSDSRKLNDYSLYTRIDKWIEDMLDDVGKYVGPSDRKYPFSKGDFVTLPYEVDYNTVYNIMKWNETFGDIHKISSREITKANKELSSDYYGHHTHDALGNWPN